MGRSSNDLYQAIEAALKPLCDSLNGYELDEYNDALKRFVENEVGEEEEDDQERDASFGSDGHSSEES